MLALAGIRIGGSRRGRFALKDPKTRLLVALAVLGLVVGCVNVKALQGKGNIERCGPYPEDYREVVRSWADTYFTNLNGISGMTITRPIPGIKSGWRTNTVYGWWTRVKVRGYDQIGMPTGSMQYNVLIRNRAVVYSQKQIP